MTKEKLPKELQEFVNSFITDLKRDAAESKSLTDQELLHRVMNHYDPVLGFPIVKWEDN